MSVRRYLAMPLHKIAHQLNRVGWWITEGPERKRKEAAIRDKAEALANRNGLAALQWKERAERAEQWCDQLQQVIKELTEQVGSEVQHIDGDGA